MISEHIELLNSQLTTCTSQYFPQHGLSPQGLPHLGAFLTLEPWNKEQELNSIEDGKYVSNYEDEIYEFTLTHTIATQTCWETGVLMRVE